MKMFTGTGVALVTPFCPDGSVDEISLRNLVDYTIEGGVNYLVALGTTSEAATLSVRESARVADVIVEQAKGRVPLVIGMGGNNTAELLENIGECDKLSSFDGLLSVTPYYNKPSQEGMYEHFKLVAEKSPIPVILYNVPGRTGINLTAATTARLSQDCPNIVGIKEASGSLEQATAILCSKRSDFVVLSGDDALTLPLMSIGVEGVISVIANIHPKEFSDMVRHAASGNFKAAAVIHLQLSEMCKALFLEGNPAGVKAALHAKGVIANNRLRLPLTPASAELYQKIKGLL